MNDKNKTKSQLIKELNKSKKRISQLEIFSSKKYESLHRTILRNISDTVFITDEKGKFTYICPNVSVIFGYSIKEVKQIGTMDKLFGKILVTPDELNITGEIENLEWKVFDKNNKEHILLINIKHVSIPNQGPILYTCRDITQRKSTEIKLQKSEAKLRIQKTKLEKKNIALKEILEQIEIEKKQIKDQVNINTEKLLMPILKKLKINSVSIEKEYIDLLISNLEKLTSSFGSNLNRISTKLTPRELEICNMIKNGLRSKEISNVLNISLPTVERHRNNIRKKMDINNKDINLSVYLQTL